MRCIICLTEKSDQEMSREHVFPDSIGGSLTNRRVCKACNSYLGSKVDVHLTDHVLIQGKRAILGISGKSGNIPNPIKKGTLADNPSQRVDYVIRKDGSFSHVYLHPRVSQESIDQDTRIRVSIDGRDMGNLPTVVNKILTRNGYPALESDQIQELATTESLDQPTIKFQLAVDIIKYQKSILKIAYQLAWHWLGEAYLEDKTGSVLRECFLDEDCPLSQLKDKYKVKGDIGMGMQSQVSQVFTYDQSHHLAIMMPSDKGVSLYIRIFDIFEGTIVVSEDSYDLQEQDSKILVINSVSKEHRETDLASEIQRLLGN